MRFDVLVEGQSDQKVLERLIPKIIGFEPHTVKFRAYQGLGRIPKNMQESRNARKQKLLEHLPLLLRAYGKACAGSGFQAVVIVVCDLDKNDKETFLNELESTLHACDPKPEAHFCLAIEEVEAWLLGDIPAIKAAYPEAKTSVLDNYVNDSICDTWEILADAVYPGGYSPLKAKGWQTVGWAKSQWAEKITSHMVVERNASPSFVDFRTQLRELAGLSG